MQRHNKQGTEIFEGKVRDMSSDGRGVIALPDGKIAFVSGVWVGEHVRFKTTGSKGRVVFATLLELIEASPYRITAACPYHGDGDQQCGGCPWMFVEYEEQLRVKMQRVEQGISRLSASCDIKAILGADKTLAYRNRAQFKTNGREIGFVASGTNKLVPIDQCLVLEDKNNRTLHALRASLPNSEWIPKKRTPWVTLDVDIDTSAEAVSVNQRLPFRQANDRQNVRMREWLSSTLMHLSFSGKILELFCGAGNFTQILAAQNAVDIVAVEASEDSIMELNAQAWPNVSAEVQNLYNPQVFKQFCAQHQDAELLFLDPPRDGLQATEGLITKKSRLSEIIYISCDLATLLRDLKFFIEHGFVLQQVQPIDLFPQTPHIEVMVHLSRKKRK